MSNERFSIVARLRSFKFAISGLTFVLRSQHNAQVHLAISTAVGVAGFVFGLSKADWLAILIAMSIVWIAETLNTAVEYVCDVVSPEFNTNVARAKDIAAGAVLISAVFAVIVGALVFVPYLVSW
jgi:diacylglycerol kinase (ATP)